MGDIADICTTDDGVTADCSLRTDEDSTASTAGSLRHFVEGSTASTAERQAILERVAAELIVLRSHLTRATHSHLHKQMVERTESIETALVDRLDAAFTAAIRTKNEREVLSCLQTYFHCSKTANALNVIHLELVQQAVEQIMQQDRIDASGPVAKYNGLHAVYDELLEFVKTDLGFILDGARRSALTSRGDVGLDVIGETVWPEVGHNNYIVMAYWMSSAILCLVGLDRSTPRGFFPFVD